LLLVVIPEGNLRLHSAYTLEAIADFVMVYGVAAFGQYRDPSLRSGRRLYKNGNRVYTKVESGFRSAAPWFRNLVG